MPKKNLFWKMRNLTLKKSNYKQAPKFEDVVSVPLRVWNRCAIIFNLRADVGDEEARKYVAQFDEVSKKQIKAMFDYIAVKGYDTTRREVTNGTMDKMMVA